MNDTNDNTKARQNTQDKEWTAKELDLLRREAHQGAAMIAAVLGRSERSVRCAASRHRISLRKKGERRGLILGQPRGINWQDLRRYGVTAHVLKAIKADALSGLISLTELEARVAKVIAGEEPVLCPMCAVRPVEHLTGICRSCHLNLLAEQHRHARDAYEAQQNLWAARQESSRARRKANRMEADGTVTT